MVYHFKKNKAFFPFVTLDFDRPMIVGLSWAIQISSVPDATILQSVLNVTLCKLLVLMILRCEVYF